MKDKRKVLLELRTSDSRAAEQWVMHSTAQQRLLFDHEYEYAPFAQVFASDDASVAPVTIAPVELDVVESPASVDCVLHLSPDEVCTCGHRQSLFFPFPVFPVLFHLSILGSILSRDDGLR